MEDGIYVLGQSPFDSLDKGGGGWGGKYGGVVSFLYVGDAVAEEGFEEARRGGLVLCSSFY